MIITIIQKKNFMATTILNGIKEQVSFGKITGKNSVMIRTMFFFRNQIFLDLIWL